MEKKYHEREHAVFKAALPGLLTDPANRGKFALLHDGQIVGLYPNLDTAREAGEEKFELAPFLVMEVNDQIKPLYFSRPIACRS
jgi:hypothetical protein